MNKPEKPSAEYMAKYNLQVEYDLRLDFVWIPRKFNGKWSWLCFKNRVYERFQYHDINVVSWFLNTTTGGNYDTLWSPWRPIEWYNKK